MAEIGLYALRFALVAALAGIGAGVHAALWAGARSEHWTRVAERATWLVFGSTSISMTALFVALGVGDYQIAYVATNSAATMPLGYRLSALWSGQAGSLLLWLWLLAAYTVAAVWMTRGNHRRLTPWVIAILLANACFFLVLTNFVTVPFDKLPPTEVMSDGRGMNPLLQHPAMMIHPLMLYTGFVGFSVPFSFALAALITGELDTTWFRVTRRAGLIAWSFLGVGLALGGRWAYEVLGWGGYWAWDPVENAALMPWLVATAYLHSVMIQEKRDMLKIWNLVLIGLTYTFCLFGTFLTRSGVVQSVHSFTNSGWFGFIFLAYVATMAITFFTALILRRGQLRSPNRIQSMASREASFLFNNWLFLALLMVVFWGTMLPVFSESISGQRLTVGPKFFNALAGPLALGLLFLTGVGPLIAWRRATPTNLRRQFVWPTVAGISTAVALAVLFWGRVGFFPLVCWSLGAFVTSTIAQEYTRAIAARRRRRGESIARAFATLLRRNQPRYGGYIVHLGVVLLLIGIAGAAFNEERLENVQPGDSTSLSEYRLEYLTADPIEEQHYGGAKARVALYRGDTPLGVMTPEKRIYWLEQQPTSIPAIYSTLIEDVYVILAAIEADGSATLKIYRNPLVNWIWIGLGVYTLGCFAILWPHRERVAE